MRWAVDLLLAPARLVGQRANRVRDQRRQVEAAVQRLDLEKILGGYRAGLTQDDLNAAGWDDPGPSTLLIEEETDRIAAYLNGYWQAAGFPEQPVRAVKEEMLDIWDRLQGRVHQQVFGQLDLPPFFELTHSPTGMIMAEHVQRGVQIGDYETWIWTKSSWGYGYYRPKLRYPSAK